MHPNRNFTSDNVAPAAREVLAAVVESNEGVTASYGADPYTARLITIAGELFEKEVAVFPVATGTAANALGLAAIAPPYGAIYCHETAHIVTDECGAPEFFSGGAKTIGLPAGDGRIGAAQLAAAIAFANEMGVHHVKPAALSVTQATEWGTVYGLDQIAELTAVAKRHGLGVHMDGARFANALAHLGCTAAEATWKRGVDILSLGATKNGALCAEAVVVFDRQLARDLDRRRKRAGHLWSKQRYLSAQLLAYLNEDLWLRNARHANAMAATLARGLASVPGAKLMQPVEANEVFIALPAPIVEALERAGFGFYRWPLCAPPEGVAIRLVASYATEVEDVEALIAAARQGVEGLRGA